MLKKAFLCAITSSGDRGSLKVKFSLLTLHVGRIQDGGISMIPMSRTALTGINFNTECISFFDFVHISFFDFVHIYFVYPESSE